MRRMGQLKSVTLAFAAAALIATLSHSAQAQETYPNRTIRLIVGLPPAGATI